MMDLSADSPKSVCYMDDNRENFPIPDISISSSFSAPKISGTTDSIASAIDKELGVNLHENPPTRSFSPVIHISRSSPATSHPVIVKPLYSDEPIQISSIKTETQFSPAQSEPETEEKSAYEIAAEALCLMKQSVGIVPSSTAQVNDEASGPSVYISDSSIDLSVESEIVIDSATDQINSFGDSVELSLDNANSVSMNHANTGKKVVKYVLVPESSIISADNSSNISKTGMPLLYMLPQGDGTQQKVYKLARPHPTIIKLKKKVTPESIEALLSNGTEHHVLDRSELEIINSYSLASTDDNTNHGKSIQTKPKRGKQQISKKHDTLKFPPCIICTGEASGLHYGCNTCEACKNFFRRCLLRKSSAPFVCHSGNNCEISFKKNKNNCSACRLRKCTEAGMSKEKCKMGRYTALMRTETIKKVRKLEGKDADSQTVIIEDSSMSPSTSYSGVNSDKSNASPEDEMFSREMLSNLATSDSHIVTEFDSHLVSRLVTAMHDMEPYGKDLCTPEAREAVCKDYYEKYRAKVAMFGSMANVSMSEYQTLLKKYGIDIDGQWKSLQDTFPHWEVMIGKYCQFMKHVPTFSNLEYDDQANLLKSTHSDFFTILCHHGYVQEYGVYLEANGQPFHIDEAGDRFITKELMMKSCDLTLEMQKLNLHEIEMALLLCIVSMSPDRCQLKNPKLVESTQLQLTDLLIKQLKLFYGPVKGRQRFTSFIDILTKLRDLSHKYMKEYKTLCDDEMIKKNFPDFDICLPEEV